MATRQAGRRVSLFVGIFGLYVGSICSDKQIHPDAFSFSLHSFYFPGILVGPYLDLSEYRKLVGEVMFDDPSVKLKAQQGRKLPLGRKRVAYMRMFMGLLYLGLFVVFGATHNFSAALEPWFAKKNILIRYANPSCHFP
jgi:lysophospholipid acyltransferase